MRARGVCIAALMSDIKLASAALCSADRAILPTDLAALPGPFALLNNGDAVKKPVYVCIPMLWKVGCVMWHSCVGFLLFVLGISLPLWPLCRVLPLIVFIHLHVSLCSM